MAVASRGVPEDYVPFHDGASSYNNFGARLESAQQVAGLLLQSHHVLSIGMADPSQISQQGNLWNPPGQHAPIANVAVTPMYGLDAGLALMPVPQPQSHQVNVTSFPVAGLSAAGSSASCTFPGNYQIPQTAAGCQENHSGGFLYQRDVPASVQRSQLLALSSDHLMQLAGSTDDIISSSSGMEELTEAESDGNEVTRQEYEAGGAARSTQVNRRERGRIRSINEHLNRLKALLNLDSLPCSAFPVTPCCLERRHTTCIKSQSTQGSGRKGRPRPVKKCITKVHILRAAYHRIRDLQKQVGVLEAASDTTPELVSTSEG